MCSDEIQRYNNMTLYPINRVLKFVINLSNRHSKIIVALSPLAFRRQCDTKRSQTQMTISNNIIFTITRTEQDSSVKF